MINKLISDSFHGILPSDIPFFILQLTLSALTAQLFIFLYKHKSTANEKLSPSVLIKSVLLTMMVSIVNVMPLFSIVILAVFLHSGINSSHQNANQQLYQIVILSFAATIGSGNIVLALICLPIIMLYIYFNKPHA